jgi:CBS domain-containing protein
VPRARADMPVKDAIALVLRGSHKLLAVVDGDGRLQGVLDRADLLRGLLAR